MEFLDFDLVESISESLDRDADIESVNVLNFRALFKDSVSSHHMIPCRVCHSFRRVQIAFTDMEDPHKAAALCAKHYLQFKSFYRFATNDKRPLIEDLPEFPLAEEVVASLIREDGTPFCDHRVVYDSNEYEILADLSYCDFFLSARLRDTMIKKIRKGVAKEEHREYIERIGKESSRVYGLDLLPFPGPWENLEWWEPKRITHERQS